MIESFLLPKHLVKLIYFRLLLPCVYGEPSVQSEIRSLRAKLHNLENYITTGEGFHGEPVQLKNGLDIKTFNHPSPYPIPSRWYMPMLISYCKWTRFRLLIETYCQLIYVMPCSLSMATYTLICRDWCLTTG
jgi:hypothetical protein